MYRPHSRTRMIRCVFDKVPLPLEQRRRLEEEHRSGSSAPLWPAASFRITRFCLRPRPLPPPLYCLCSYLFDLLLLNPRYHMCVPRLCAPTPDIRRSRRV